MSVEISSVGATNAVEFTTQTTTAANVSSQSSNYQTTTVWLNLINTAKPAIHEQMVFHFGWLDYGFFVGLLSISALIGVFYGFISAHKQNNTTEYMLGGRSMKILPVATSLIASHISGQTLVGLPTEIYSHGTQYVVFVLAAILLGLALAYIFLPLFHRLGVTSTFEYLERRFDRRIRLLGSFIYTVKFIFFIPLVIYVPALAFSQVSGLNIHLITPMICTICIFYTTFGGLRAVVWTDFIQFILMVAAIITIVMLGASKVGGFANVWSTAERGGRLIWHNMDPSPFVRTSFWSLFLGLSCQWLAISGVGQSTVQRFLSVPDLKAAQRSVVYFVFGMILIKMFAIALGLCIYATYEHCDPIHAGVIKRADEIVPYYVVQIGQQMPGIAGLFVAGIFAAGLATMSSALNTMAGTIYTDFIKDCLRQQTEKEASTKMKWIAVIVGILVTILVFLVEKLGSVFQVAASLGGVISGSLLAMFILGMTSRSANTQGVIWGVTVSCTLLIVMLFGAQMNGVSKDPTLPIQVDECSNLIKHMENVVNSTIQSVQSKPVEIPTKTVFWLFRISFMLYSVVGFVVAMVVGQVVSWLTGGTTQQIDEHLLIPFFQSKEFKQRSMHIANSIKYLTVDQMLIEMTKIESKHDENAPDDEAIESGVNEKLTAN